MCLAINWVHLLTAKSRVLVLCGQTPFCTEGKGLGHGHRAVCHPHRGVYTNHSAVFSHIIPDVINRKILVSVESKLEV